MPRFISLCAICTLLVFSSLAAQGTVIVRPVETGELLLNPGKGFNTSQHVEAFPGPDGRFDITERPLDESMYPKTTIAYLRFDWRVIEPEPDEYNWYIIDEGLRMAVERGQKLALRLIPYGSHEHADIPAWLREEIGPSGELPHRYWRVDPEDPRYVENFTDFIRDAGARYDGHPDIEFLDIAIVGFWGEGAGSGLLSQDTRERLVDAYIEAWPNTQLVMLLTDERTNRYGRSQANAGWRVDCLGDLGFWADDQGGWTHMWDYYPQGIIEFGMRHAWKTAPVVLELCGVFNTWLEREGYSDEQVDYIIEQSLKWHVSVVNAKSSPVPPRWRGRIDNWLKRMGYRLVLRKFTYPESVRPHGKLAFTTWWENKGVAPPYKEFPLAIRLSGQGRELVRETGADVRDWLPGDVIYDSAVFLPLDFPEGEYRLDIGLLDPLTGEPAVSLAIEGRLPDGWYRMGTVRVEK